MIDLPEKFSAGIRLAVSDMKKCAKSSRYKIDMAVWHYPTEYETSKGVKKVCEVCMGGAVMSRNFKISPKEPYCPENLPDSLGSKIRAFDYLRDGSIIDAVCYYSRYPVDISLVEEDDMLDDYCPYEQSPKKFYKWCLYVADELEKKGY